MRFLRNTLYAIGVVTTLALSRSCIQPHSREQKNVDWGYIEYNRGPLTSDDYHGCSAVALDCGEGGFLAHAFPPAGPLDKINVIVMDTTN